VAGTAAALDEHRAVTRVAVLERLIPLLRALPTGRARRRGAGGMARARLAPRPADLGTGGRIARGIGGTGRCWSRRPRESLRLAAT